MNTYQKKLIEQIQIRINENDAFVKVQEQNLVIQQSPNAYLEKYTVIFESPAIEKIRIDSNDFMAQNRQVNIEIDFSNRIKQLTLFFYNSIVEPITFDLQYLETSKQKWDEKNRLEKWAALEKKSNITVATGSSLVNIYFQPCADEYGKTVVELYTAQGRWGDHPSVMGRGEVFVPNLISATPGMIMGKYTVEDGMFFKSITGLAHGAYGFKLIQYSKHGEILFSTNYKFFAIK